MRVLDLVANLKDEGKQYIDIHAALKAGQRGNIPVVSPEEIQALTVGQIERRMSLEIQRLQTEVTAAQEQLKELETVKAQNARLEERIELREEQVKSLTEQLEVAQNKLESLNREVGKAYLEGYKEALQSQNGKQEKD